VTGRTPSSSNPEHFGCSYPFITPSDISLDNRHIETERYVSEEGKESLERILLPKGAICFVCIGATIGKICVTSRPSFTNQQINSVVVDESKHDSRFAFYALSLQGGNAKALAGGAATPIINKSAFSDIEIEVPDLPTQRKIAGILSAYDDLIENNLRRIKILEEMAQSLYREWFVHFRFPGHESVNFVESELGQIPEGWEVKTIEEIVKRIPVGKKYDQKTASPTGSVPIFDQGKTGVIGYHDDQPGVEASEDDPAIVFANHTCYQRLVHYPFSAIQNVLPFLPSPKIPRNIYWLHYATNGRLVLNDYKGHWPEFAALFVVVPASDVCERFGAFVAPLSLEVLKLERAIQVLRQTRDLLLPKLLQSGS
jgi:type I restriction enzyme S subunit